MFEFPFSRKAGARLLAFLALAMCVAGAAWAQGSGTSTIQGRVTDQSGAVVPGAKVTVKNMDTNAVRIVETDEQGNYRANLLQPGTYEVTAEATGFSATKRPDLRLEVGTTSTINFELKVAGGEAVITVTEQTPITEPERVEVASVVGQKQVEELPINGRRWDNFVLLTPGVSPDGTFGLISSRGISGLLNNNTVDGADNNQAFFSEARGRTRVSYTISQSSIQEFQVGLSTFSAEFGRAAGGTINAVTKSGSNDWHGELFYYIRDDSMQAREPTLRDPAGNALKNDDRRQQYGLGLGGPLIRDKVFFYGNYDGQHRTETYLAAASGTSFFTDFLTGPPGNPAAGCLGAGVPAPQLVTNCNVLLQYFQGLAVQNPRKRVNNVALGKVDWHITPNHIFTGSYNWHRWRSPNGIQTQQTLNRALSDNGFDGVKTDIFIARLNSVISPRMVNEAKFHFGRDFENQLGNSTDPRTTITNGLSFGMSEFLPRPAWPDEKRFQWVDTLSWTTGRHTWKFGADINYVRNLTENIRFGGGQYSYTSLTGLAQDCPPETVSLGCVQINTGATTGLHYSSFQQAFDLRSGGGSGDLFFSTTDWNFFIQDTFKWLPNVTINAGLRYEYQALPKVIPVTIGTTTFTGHPQFPESASFNSDTNNFGPRFAVAWDVTSNQKNIIRFGGGIYYGRTPNALLRSGMLENGVAVPSFTMGPTVPGAPLYPTILSSVPSGAGSRNVAFLASDYVRPFITMADVAFERELAKDISFSVTYLFTRGNHLTHGADINLNAPTTTVEILFDADGSTGTTTDRTSLGVTQFFAGPRPLFDTLSSVPTTRLNQVIRETSELNSTYNGVIFQVTQRNRWGLTQTAHFTVSRAEDDGQAMGGSPFAASFERFFNPFNRFAEYGRSDFDVTKRFVWFFIWNPSQMWSTDKAAMRNIFGDWSFNGILTASDGQPFQPSISGSISGSGTNASSTFTINGSGASNRLGWLKRNPLETTGFFVIDFRVQKDIRVTEGMKVRFLWEAFNLLNRTNAPNRFNYGTTAFRVLASSTVGGPASNLTLPRQVVLRQDTNYANVMNPITGRGDLGNCTTTTCLSSASGVLFGARDMQFGLKFIF